MKLLIVLGIAYGYGWAVWFTFSVNQRFERNSNHSENKIPDNPRRRQGLRRIRQGRPQDRLRRRRLLVQPGRYPEGIRQARREAGVLWQGTHRAPWPAPGREKVECLSPGSYAETMRGGLALLRMIDRSGRARNGFKQGSP